MTQYDDEIVKNAALMNKCRRIYNRVSILYAAVFIPYTLMCIILGLLGMNAVILCDSLFLKPPVIICGIMACYKKNNKFLIYVICIQIISAFVHPGGDTFIDVLFGSLITGVGFNVILAVLAGVLSGFTIYANKKYHWLEEQYGFPHFNERQIRYDEESLENSIKDKYQRNYERIVENNFHDMQELNSVSGDKAVIPESTSKSGVMDDI